MGHHQKDCSSSRALANAISPLSPGINPRENSTAIRLTQPGSDPEIGASHFRQFTQTLLDNLTEGALLIDPDNRIVEANIAAAQFINQKSKDIRGKDFKQYFQFLDVIGSVAISNPIQEAIACQKTSKVRLSLILLTPNKSELLVKITASPISTVSGELKESGTVVILENITHSQKLGQQLHWQSNHDPITGLINRIYFENILGQVIHHNTLDQHSYILAHIDIDNFKIINDTCGNIAGDQLLGQLAIELQEKIRSVDTLARLGGDEFGILFHQCSLDEAYAIVEKLQKELEKFRYVWQRKSLRVALSIGLVRLDEETKDVEIALSKADTACYTAKNRGRNCIQVFSSRDVDMEDLKRHQEWNFLIREALEDNRFHLYRQPIVGINGLDDLPHHYEVLLRMVNSAGVIIGPNHFIPTAERYQLMPSLDRWVISQCLNHLEHLAEEHSTHLLNPLANYAINLSGASLSDPNFLAELIDSISHCKLTHKKLCFEITETAAITNLKQVNHFMTTLKEMGCRFSLDDFGAGMSSFGYLSSLPVDFVKIDGKFIQDLEIDPSNVTIVESIVHVSKSLGLMTIAERVEERSTAIRLKEIGVDFIQGFGVGRPHRWI